jgi:plastocyanin
VRRVVVLAALGVAVCLASLSGLLAPAFAAVAHIGVNDYEFTPSRAAGKVGDTVSWEWAGGLDAPHDVYEDHRLFRSGPASATAGTTFKRTPSAGSYHYYCTLHGGPSGGMAGTVRIAPVTNDGPIGAPFDVVWATSTRTGSAFDVQYRKAGGLWKVWRTDTAAFAGTFGKQGNPITVLSGEIYEFRARSQADASSPTRVSGWSPTARYTAP